MKLDRITISEHLILTGGLIFAAGIMWTHVLGYVGLALGLLGICLNLKGKEAPPIAKTLVVLILDFILWGLILVLTTSERRDAGWATVFGYGSHWLLAFALGFRQKERYRIGLIYIFAGSVILVGLLSLGAYLGFYDNPNLAKWGMIWGFHHHIAFAAILLIVFHLIYGSVLTPGIPFKKTVILSLFGFLAILLVILTGSRSYWFAGGLSIAAATIYNAIVGRRRILSLALAGIGILVVVVGVAIFPQVRQRIKITNTGDSSIVFRKNMAIMAINIIKDHPITGIGPGQVPYAKEYYDRMDSLNLPVDTGYLQKKHLHNIYLQIGAEFGVAGMILLFAIIISMLTISAKAVSNTGDYSGIAVGLFWGVVTIAIGENFDCLLRAPSVSMMIFWLVGLSAGVLKIDKGVKVQA